MLKQNNITLTYVCLDESKNFFIVDNLRHDILIYTWHVMSLA